MAFSHLHFKYGLRIDDRQPPAHFAALYRDNHLTGGHIIKLGPGNDEAAREACKTWPGGMQVGGGINDENAQDWLGAGASKVSLDERAGSRGVVEGSPRF